jgi:hypothetical protein
LWQAIADNYDLDLENRDKNEIRKILEDCAD